MTRTSASWIRRSATVVVSAAAVTVGLGLTAAPSMAATGQAASAGSSGVHQGNYRTWPAAQSAAGFSLLRPVGTNGLKSTGSGIMVGQCANYPSKYAQVYAQYGSGSGKFFALIQDDAPHAAPCSNIGETTTLGHYKVDGARATLLGACGVDGLPSCHSAHLWLFLTWIRHGHYYEVLSHDEGRSTIVAFARRLHSVS